MKKKKTYGTEFAVVFLRTITKYAFNEFLNFDIDFLLWYYTFSSSFEN